ncbi:outer membrane protein assembly factor BamE [Marichromatium gracile]|uniref:Outer membrane protein assembly factor BamE n=2 Tax=Marichromatium gracile TaxID=1048 RepID=A0ABR5VLM9_MARGR|nr:MULTISPECIES: outer membrane protein assembly factor BamE [Marichromatium]KXX65327.1 cell envelope protein SmpA [Marichromatium gracile]MBO8085478.1 outer membrane protein assembly factor BamE [Marichromatium sp.]MCF1184193.1 outer membrane protein assembly factor BamE [Marichromatium gracile]
MRKILTFSILGSLLIIVASGCSRDKRPDEYRSSMLENLPFVYKMTVQQGNIITEEMIDQLQPGMTRRQVQYLLGTPLLTDFFHNDRWDYTYTIKRGHQPMEIRYLTLYFAEDSLVRIEGDIKPDPARAESREPREILVKVPDHEGRKGLVERGLKAVGLDPEE